MFLQNLINPAQAECPLGLLQDCHAIIYIAAYLGALEVLAQLVARYHRQLLRVLPLMC
jgi:hypothetical protein